MCRGRAHWVSPPCLGFVEDERGGLLDGPQPVPLGRVDADALGLGRVTVSVEQLGCVLAVHAPPGLGGAEQEAASAVGVGESVTSSRTAVPMPSRSAETAT